jgi:trimeric autotransporter adhesin
LPHSLYSFELFVGDAADQALHSGESPAERDARLQAEAAERMKAKFQSNKMSGISSSSYGSISSSGSGSGGGGGNGAEDDLLTGVASFAETAFSRLSQASIIAASRVAETSRELSKKVVESDITSKLSKSVSNASASLQSTISDPNLMDTVSKSANSFWNKASSVGSSFWSSANSVAKQVASEFSSGISAAAAGSGVGVGSQNDGSMNSPRMSLKQSSEDINDRTENVSIRGSSSDENNVASGANRNSKQPTSINGGKKISPSESLKIEEEDEEDDDAAWLAAQVAKANIANGRKPVSSSSSGTVKSTLVEKAPSAETKTSKPQSKVQDDDDEDELDGWGDVEDEDEDSWVTAPVKTVPLKASSKPASGSRAPLASAVPKDDSDNDDFFKKFDMK